MILIAERKRWLSGVSLVILGAVYFIVAVGFIVPLYYTGEGISNLSRYSTLGSTWGGVIRTMLIHPLDVIIFFIKHRELMPIISLFDGFGFLGILAPVYLIPVLLGLLPHILSWAGGQFRLSEIYVAADVKGNSHPFTYEEWKQAYDKMSQSGWYAKIYDNEGYQLWKKKGEVKSPRHQVTSRKTRGKKIEAGSRQPVTRKRF